MILHHNRMHASITGETREIDRIHGPGQTVRAAMAVDIDHAGQRSSLNVSRHSSARRWLLSNRVFRLIR
jgi:hypothetical protein